MKPPLSQSIYRKTVWAAVLLVIILLSWQLLVQRYFVSRVREIYETNMDYVITQLVDDIQTAFTLQVSAVEQIADHVDIKDYAATDNVEERYGKAYNTARPIVQMAIANTGINHAIIYDNTRAWYQYVGILAQSDCRTVRSAFPGLKGTTSTLLSLSDGLHLCSITPLIWLDSHNQLQRVGLVAVLSHLEQFHAALNAFDQLNAGTILLHNRQTVLLSNQVELENLAYADIPMDAGKYYIRNETALPGLLYMTILVPKEQIFPQQTAFAMSLLGSGLVSLMVLLIGWQLMNWWLVRPYGKVLAGMERLGEENLSGRLPYLGLAHMDELVRSVNRMMDRAEEASRREISAQQTLYEAKLSQQQIEMVLLHKQIDAHFLYNSLIGIKCLCDQGDADKASEISQGVAALLRYAHSTNERVPIFEEMSIIQRYIHIMNIRFADRFSVTFDVDDQLADYAMPKMILQPLVENALVHGLEVSMPPCLLEIHGVLETDAIALTVWDNGAGISPAMVDALRLRLSQWEREYRFLELHGISLVNIQRRLTCAYGAPYGLTLESEEGAFTRVTVRIPKLLLQE